MGRSTSLRQTPALSTGGPENSEAVCGIELRELNLGLNWAPQPSDCFVARVAEALEIAFNATRLARLTDLAPVPDQLVRKEDPFFLRNNLHQVLLDFPGIGIA
jgi:hypothetical protein